MLVAAAFAFVSFGAFAVPKAAETTNGSVVSASTSAPAPQAKAGQGKGKKKGAKKGAKKGM